MKSLIENADDQSVLSRGSNEIVRLFIYFLCLGMVIAAIKTLTECEGHVVCLFSTAKYSAAAIYKEICNVYNPMVMKNSYGVKELYVVGYVQLKVALTNTHDKCCPLKAGHCFFYHACLFSHF